jgi:hypothetical protein
MDILILVAFGFGVIVGIVGALLIEYKEYCRMLKQVAALEKRMEEFLNGSKEK